MALRSKGITPVIGMILLILIVVALGGVFAAWTTGTWEDEEECVSRVYQKEEMWCCTPNKTMCWTENSGFVVSDWEGNRLNNEYTCKLENHTHFQICYNEELGNPFINTTVVLGELNETE